MCNFPLNLTPNPFPIKEGEQESKPLSVGERYSTRRALLYGEGSKNR